MAWPLATVPTQLAMPDPSLPSLHENAAATLCPGEYVPAVGDVIVTSGPRPSILKLNGPTVAQCPSRSQTTWLVVAAVGLWPSAGTFVVSVNIAGDDAVSPTPLSVAVQSTDTFVWYHTAWLGTVQLATGALRSTLIPVLPVGELVPATSRAE